MQILAYEYRGKEVFKTYSELYLKYWQVNLSPADKSIPLLLYFLFPTLCCMFPRIHPRFTSLSRDK